MDSKESGWLQPSDSDFLAFLRALSIGIIVFGHVGGFWFYPPWTEYLHVFIAIFFFISGAVSYNSFLKSETVDKYLVKRTINLIAPYYLIAFFSLIFFLFLNKTFPDISIQNIIKWLTILPERAISPFPLGQVWFLHTLLIIIAASPFFFKIYIKNKLLIIPAMGVPLIISIIQLIFDIDDYFIFNGHNLYKPIVHSFFFCLGFTLLDSRILMKRKISLIIAIIFLGISIATVFLFNLNPDYAEHTFAPDFYYISGCISSIFISIYFYPYAVKLFNTKFFYLKKIIYFFYKHTFSIFLIHTFSIFISEIFFGLTNPEQKNITYGLIKLTMVLLITSALSPLFTRTTFLVSNKVVDLYNKLTVKNKLS